ncbi:hypothetical protein EYC80_004477 [Monilinia laxa]|uniref:Uncharacterized protein n=1 Tax=Monilinia laxa TaxID=61186 RepID=A0A5N6KNH1_MONLA|nr:hypothetical protein EYC80_004477 [Monilinia laxa]
MSSSCRPKSTSTKSLHRPKKISTAVDKNPAHTYRSRYIPNQCRGANIPHQTTNKRVTIGNTIAACTTMVLEEIRGVGEEGRVTSSLEKKGE